MTQILRLKEIKTLLADAGSTADDLPSFETVGILRRRTSSAARHAALKRESARLAFEMQGTLRKLLFEIRSSRRRSREWSGDEWDESAILDRLSDLAAGKSTDGRLYRRHNESRRYSPPAVGVLVDVSGSSGGGSIDILRPALAVIGSALSAIGTEFALFAFDSGCRVHQVSELKRISDPWNDGCIARIAALEPGGGSCMAPPTRHAIAHMLESRNPNRLLILAGDSWIFDLEETVWLLRLAEPRKLRGVFLRFENDGEEDWKKLGGCGEIPRAPNDPWITVPTVRDFPRILLDVFRRSAGLGTPLPFKLRPRHSEGKDPFRPLSIRHG